MSHKDKKLDDADTEKQLDAITSGNAVDCASCGEIIHIEEDEYIRFNGQSVHIYCLESDIEMGENPE